MQVVLWVLDVPRDKFPEAIRLTPQQCSCNIHLPAKGERSMYTGTGGIVNTRIMNIFTISVYKTTHVTIEFSSVTSNGPHI